MSLSHRSSLHGSTLRWGALLAGLLLAACPQLLDDGFDERLIPPVQLTGSGGTLGGGSPQGVEPDASAGGAPAGGASSAGAGGAPSSGAAAADAGEPTSAAGSGAAPDAGAPGAELRAALLHRYRFDEAGTTILDSIGTAHGTAVNAQVGAGSGKLVLSGSNQYVDLPNGLISGLVSVTLEAWVNWAAEPAGSAADWQPVFAFGSNDTGEGSPGDDGTSYVHVTAKNGDSGDLRGGYTLAGYNAELFVDADDPLPTSSDPTRGTQVVLVLRGTADGGSVALYVDGALQVASAAGQSIQLAAIADVNNWLGQSQFSSDPTFNGEFLDFRIYGSALDAAQIALSHSLGADAEL